MRNVLQYYIGLLPPCWALVLGEVPTACRDVHCYAQWQTEPLQATLPLLIGFQFLPIQTYDQKIRINWVNRILCNTAKSVKYLAT